MITLRILSLLILISFLPCCFRRRVTTNTSLSAKLSKKQKPLYVAVNDIECEDCAQAVLDIFSKCGEIASADFQEADGNSQNLTSNCIKICLRPDFDFPTDTIKELLCQEGFTLNQISEKPFNPSNSKDSLIA